MTRLLADRYELGDVVGAGGVARVHRAVDRRLERAVAVKMLDDRQARSADPSGRDRFLREARSAGRIQHPHLVTVFDAGEDAGELYLVMEFVDGVSLAAIISQRAPLPIDEAVSIAVQILEGLSAVHDDGTIHRDVKPSNVLIDGDGQVRLTDFGIAKRLDDIEESLTSAGSVVGTPHYLAPEQAAGQQLGFATDIYLVGLVLDEMLTGRRPAGSALDPRRARSDVPAGVAEAVLRATDPDPRHRYGSARQMIAALRAAPSRVATQAFPVVTAAGRVDQTTVMPGGARSGVAAGPTTTLAPVPIPTDAPRWWSGWWLLATAAIVVALVVGVFMVTDSDPNRPAEPASSIPSTVPGTAVVTAPGTSAPAATIMTAITRPPADQGGPPAPGSRPGKDGSPDPGKDPGKKKKHDEDG